MKIKKNKRGFTLTELVITITVMTIAVTMATTLCILVNKTSAKKAQGVNIMTDADEARGLLDDWFSYHDSTGCQNIICPTTGDTILQTGAQAGADAVSFAASTGILSARFGSEVRAVTLKVTEGITVSVPSNVNGVYKAVMTMSDGSEYTLIFSRKTQFS